MHTARASESIAVHTTPLPAWITSGFDLAEVRGHRFSAQSPLGALYAESVSSPQQHQEGREALIALSRYFDSLREVPGRMDQTSFWKRMEAVVRFVEDTLRSLDVELPTGRVEGVVVYGSVLRGKAAAGDLDVRVVTSYEPGEIIDFNHPVMSKVESAVHRLAVSEGRMSLEVDGLPIRTDDPWINSEYVDRIGQGLSYVTRGPYLAFVKLGGSQGAQVPMGVFFNCAGTTYMAERAV
ncbi:MAG: hypothetical protein QY326_08470 [Bdellovibrionota bacterium]|nr:MAG: hypothetical protein QY326_08470 [Bdellovibrionota bacterium]